MWIPDLSLTLLWIGHRQVLVTEHGKVGAGKYLDPRSGQSFAFDHLRKAVSDVEAADVDDCGGFRSAYEKAVTDYTEDHYEKGTCTVRSHRPYSWPALSPAPLHCHFRLPLLGSCGTGYLHVLRRELGSVTHSHRSMVLGVW